MKLLLHMCCAPCSVYPVSMLEEENIDFTGYFYNPNIHPMEEHILRRENVENFAQLKKINIVYNEEFLQGKWENFKLSFDERCFMCYSLRLDKAALFAKENGYDAFSTTLLVSPYQKHDLLIELGKKASLKNNVEFYYRDFRPGFRQGQQQAKEMGLYSQKFCGCIISYNESQHTKKK